MNGIVLKFEKNPKIIKSVLKKYNVSPLNLLLNNSKPLKSATFTQLNVPG